MELESVAEIIGGVLISREQCQNQGYKQKLFNFND